MTVIRQRKILQLLEMVVIAGFISPKELQRIVKDLFHLINEENADEASQELLAQSGNLTYKEVTNGHI